MKDNLKRIIASTTGCYTVITLALSLMNYIILDLAPEYAPNLGVLLCVLLFSLVYGVCGLLLTAKKLGSAAKRALHYLIMLITFNVLYIAVLAEEFTPVLLLTGIMIFTAVYFACVGVKALCMWIYGKYADSISK